MGSTSFGSQLVPDLTTVVYSSLVAWTKGVLLAAPETGGDMIDSKTLTVATSGHRGTVALLSIRKMTS